MVSPVSDPLQALANVRNLAVQSRETPLSPFRWYKFEANPVWLELEALAEERRCSIGDTDDFVR